MCGQAQCHSKATQTAQGGDHAVRPPKPQCQRGHQALHRSETRRGELLGLVVACHRGCGRSYLPLLKSSGTVSPIFSLYLLLGSKNIVGKTARIEVTAVLITRRICLLGCQAMMMIPVLIGRVAYFSRVIESFSVHLRWVSRYDISGVSFKGIAK